MFAKQAEGSLKFWIYLFLSVFCKFSVPLFFAISGAIMLGRKDEPLKVLWKKRIFKITIILFVFSAIYYLDSIDMDFNKLEIKTFFTKLHFVSDLATA